MGIKGKRLVTNILLFHISCAHTNHKNIRKNQSLPQVSLCSAACLYLCLCIKKTKALPFCFRDFVRIERGVHARYLLASLVSAQSPHLAPTGAVAKRAQSPSCALVELCAICAQLLNVALLEISNLASKITIFHGL